MTHSEAYGRQARPATPADRTMTVVLMLVLGLLAPSAGFFGLLITLTYDDCQSIVPCVDGPTATGALASAASPILFALVALVWVFVRWGRRVSTWWVPLVVAAAGAVVWAIGALVVVAAAP